MNIATSGWGPWQTGLMATGAAAAVILAYRYKLSGKVWLFFGGAIVGGMIGSLIDQ